MTLGFNKGRAAGFTLIEVILATVIAVGMLVLVLFFYQQTTNLRGQLLEETERLSIIRLLMDRMTAELRTTRRHAAFEAAFVGESDSIQFIKTDFPARAAWTGPALGRVAGAESDLKLVGYRLSSADATNILGVARWEQPLVKFRQPATSQLSSATENNTNRPPSLLSEAIHLLRFRYWDGAHWQDSWHADELPRGVEISLGIDGLAQGAPVNEYPGDLFRRVIYLAGAGAEQEWSAPAQLAEGRP